MTETSGQSSNVGGDQGVKDKQLPLQQPASDVEMENLSSTDPKPIVAAAESGEPAQSASAAHTDVSQPASIPVPDKDAPAGESSSNAPAKSTPANDDEDLTIDPVAPLGSTAKDGELTVDIMLVLVSNGNRHPFRIDEKYLTKRNVTITGTTEDGKMDPSSITVYTLKELILREWRPDWDQPPREPSAIRLVYFGKLLEDRMALNREYTPRSPRCGLLLSSETTKTQ